MIIQIEKQAVSAVLGRVLIVLLLFGTIYWAAYKLRQSYLADLETKRVVDTFRLGDFVEVVSPMSKHAFYRGARGRLVEVNGKHFTVEFGSDVGLLSRQRRDFYVLELQKIQSFNPSSGSAKGPHE